DRLAVFAGGIRGDFNAFPDFVAQRGDIPHREDTADNAARTERGAFDGLEAGLRLGRQDGAAAVVHVLERFAGGFAVEGAGAVFVRQAAASRPDVGDEFLRVEQTAADVHEALHRQTGVVRSGVGRDKVEAFGEGGRDGRTFSEQVGAIEN